MNVIATTIISLPILVILVRAVAKNESEGDKGCVPLFGHRDSPIELGMYPPLPEEDEEPKWHVFRQKYSAYGSAEGSGGGDPSGMHHHHLEQPEDLEKRQRQKDIRYLLRLKSGKWVELQRNGSDANSGGRWTPNGEVKVVIHGFSPPVLAVKPEESIRKMHMFEIGDAYGVASGGQNKNYNVIIVDWTSLSTEPLYKYYEAALSTSYAGEDVAEFLRNLKTLRLISSWDKVHMVGFSLGAHVAGIAGALIQRASGGGSKVGRITGIDPAGPLFEQSINAVGQVTWALNKTDANFVDVIHCNMGPVVTFAFARGKFGTILQSGHADFYPDGGESQKNCTEVQDELEACSHIKCPLIFAQSITDHHGFASCLCQSWDKFINGSCPCSRGGGSEMAMGEECSKRALGKYYLVMK